MPNSISVKRISALLSVLLFLSQSPVVAFSAPQLCAANRSKSLFALGNKASLAMKVTRIYEKDPSRPNVQGNLVIQNFGFLNSGTSAETTVALKTGSNAMEFIPYCNGEPVRDIQGKVVKKKFKYIEKRGRYPNCLKAFRFEVSDSSFSTPLYCGASYANFQGNWNCPGRGTMTINQSGPSITGGYFGGNIGQDWAAPNNGIIGAGGTISQRTFDMKLLHNTNHYSLVNGSLSSDGKSFSGGWRWYSPTGIFLLSGSWTCNR